MILSSDTVIFVHQEPMAESTELQNRVRTAPEAPTDRGGGPGVWDKIKLVIRRSVFWSYERGSWQYDLIVAAILAFIFFSPRSWFQKAPTLGLSDLRHVEGIIEVSHQKVHQVEQWTYLVDARLVQSRPSQQPEEAVRDILREGLRKDYKIVSVTIIREKSGVVLGYKAVVTR